MVPKTAEEMAADEHAYEAAVKEVKWSPSLGWGLGAGVLAGIGFYFITVAVLPVLYKVITIIPK